MGGSSRVRPPIRKTAAHPRLDCEVRYTTYCWFGRRYARHGYERRSRTDLGAVDMRHEGVLWVEFVRLCFARVYNMTVTHLRLVEVDDPSVWFCILSSAAGHARCDIRALHPPYVSFQCIQSGPPSPHPSSVSPAGNTFSHGICSTARLHTPRTRPAISPGPRVKSYCLVPQW